MRWMLVAFALAGCAGMDKPKTQWATLDGAAPLIIAHRGASGYRPEHTLEAYALAIDMGADIIEPDLVFTRDGVLVARHDRYLSGSTDVSDHPAFAARKRANDDPDDTPKEDWWIEDFTLAEMKTLRARQPFPGRSKEYDGLYEIPTFDEILALIARKAKDAGRPVGVYPETKHPAFFASIGHDFEAPLLMALEGFDAGPVFIQSFEPEILKRLKGKTNAKLVQLVDASAYGKPEIAIADIATYADAVGPAKTLVVTQSGEFMGFVADAHAHRIAVHPWTFRNDAPNAAIDRADARSDETLETRAKDLAFEMKPKPRGLATMTPRQDWTAIGVPQSAGEEFDYFYSRGVDGVFTDFPDTAVRVRDALTAPHRD